MSFAALLLAAAQPVATIDPFAVLREAYERRDAAQAASAYTQEAVVTYRYGGRPEDRHEGRAAIEASFAALFDELEPGAPLDLNFRLLDRTATEARGLYRLRVGRQSVGYGHFSATLSPEGRFTLDQSQGATLEAFEEAAGPVHLAADLEDLDRGYYARMAGRYRLADGCTLVVTRSIARLFVRNSCTQQWRGLTRVSGREWKAGEHVLDDRPSARYNFAPFENGLSPSLSITDASGTTVEARRADLYRTEDITFRAADGTQLAGTLYLPTDPSSSRAATVMVHGSGPQDRDGYASIIAVMADALAASGRTVLVYDKRGSGLSEGDGDRAGFDLLASDAIAAMRYLRARPGIDPQRVGLGGSSQAGWVAARAIELGGEPSDVLLLGAAGSALSVREQNLYNSNVQMRCAGLAAADRRLGLAQQAAFFDFLADRRHAARLDALTIRGRSRPALRDWLFPASAAVNRNDGSWYNVLAIDYDPLPVWRRYGAKATFLFGTRDDATPTGRAVQRLAGSGARIRVLGSAQHLGLVASNLCSAGLSDTERFDADLWTELDAFSAGRDNDR